MRSENENLNRKRVRIGEYRTGDGDGLMGAFLIDSPVDKARLVVVSSGPDCEDIAADWEHVSVSRKNRPPNWLEMCFIKNLFWEDHETIVQFHPKKSDYKNLHPNCLHMWKNKKIDYELPPTDLV